MKKHIFLALIISLLSSFAYAAMPAGIANEGGTCALGASLQALFRNQALAVRPAGAGASALFAAIRDRHEHQVNALAAAIGHQGQNAMAFTYLLLRRLVAENQVITLANHNGRLYQAPFIIDNQGDVAIHGQARDLGASDLNFSCIMIAVPQLGLLALAPVQPNEALARAQFETIQPRAIQQVWQRVTGAAGGVAVMNAVVASDPGHGHYVSYVQGAGQVIRCDDAAVAAAAATFADSFYGSGLLPRIIFYQLPERAAVVRPAAAGNVTVAGRFDAEARQHREQEELERVMAASRAAVAAAEARRRAQEETDLQRALAASRADAERVQRYSSTWNCSACTFQNVARSLVCAMCETRRK